LHSGRRSVKTLTGLDVARSGRSIGDLWWKVLMIPEPSELSRRERQIMDAVFALGEATVNQVVETIPSPPTAMAVRRMMHILEEKGHLRRRKSGREVIYVPRQAKNKAGRRAFEQVLDTFFGGSLEEALAAHLHSRKDRVSADERKRLIALIEQAQQEGR
jgi:predicted transcriptional regulator